MHSGTGVIICSKLSNKIIAKLINEKSWSIISTFLQKLLRYPFPKSFHMVGLPVLEILMEELKGAGSLYLSKE